MLQRTVIGLPFALSLCAALGASITACFLPLLLLLLSGDVEPNPGPRKRKGELVYTCMFVRVCVCVCVCVCVRVRACVRALLAKIVYVLTHSFSICEYIFLHVVSRVCVHCETLSLYVYTDPMDNFDCFQHWPVLQTGSGNGWPIPDPIDPVDNFDQLCIWLTCSKSSQFNRGY